jgi:hypothetical protein
LVPGHGSPRRTLGCTTDTACIVWLVANLWPPQVSKFIFSSQVRPPFSSPQVRRSRHNGVAGVGQESAWAFGFNQQFGLVFQYLKISVCQATTTDRFTSQSKTDMFGFGVLVRFFGLNRKNCNSSKREAQALCSASTTQCARHRRRTACSPRRRVLALLLVPRRALVLLLTLPPPRASAASRTTAVACLRRRRRTLLVAPSPRYAHAATARCSLRYRRLTPPPCPAARVRVGKPHKREYA